MRLFVTGATGYIGQHLIAQVVQQPWEIVCLVHPNEPMQNRQHLQGQNITVVEGDILWSVERLKGLMQGCTHVIHLAGLYSFFAPTSLFHRINVDGTRQVMQAALELGLRTIHISSCTAYGQQSGPFDETAPVGSPLSLYAATKALGDQEVRQRRAQGLAVTMLFPASVLGGGDNKVSGRYFESVARRTWVYGDRGIPMLPFRHRRMTWVHVEDVVDAIMGSVLHEESLGRDYLVGGHTHTFEEVHNMIAQERWGKPRHHKWYFPFDQALLFVATVLDPIGKLLRIEPPFGLTRDQVRTMIHGIEFTGDRARIDLLEGREYRPIQEAIEDFFQSLNID